MHRKSPISVLVYNTLFPTPSPTDPPSFSAHLSKNLVGEVRIETANFYGSLDTIEARYPGLNYAFAPHRKRLGRFPHHRRLFEAFDALGLTEAEIQGFCRWEGTLWARERYERDEGVRVVDTTGVEIGAWVARTPRYTPNREGINVKTDIEVEISENSHHHHHHLHNYNHNHNQQQGQRTLRSPSPSSSSSSSASAEADEHNHDHPADSTLSFALNARLLRAAANLEPNIPMDPEWEQYLKEASERGELNIDATREALRSMAGQIAQLHQGAEGSGVQTFQAPPAAPAA